MTECQMGFSLLTYTEMELFNIYIKSYAPYKIYSTYAKCGNPTKWNKITLMTLILQRFSMPFRNYLLDKSNIFIGSLLIWGMWSGDRSLLRKILDYENQLLWHYYPWYYMLITNLVFSKLQIYPYYKRQVAFKLLYVASIIQSPR